MQEFDELVRGALHRVAPERSVETLDPDGLLQDQIDMDSLDFIHFLETISEVTGIQIPDRDLPNFATISGACRYLQHRVGN